MTSSHRRAGAFALLSTLSLAVPLAGPAVGGAIAAGVLLVAFVVTDGPVFEWFAYPADYDHGRLNGLISFVLAATVLGVFVVGSTMPVEAFVASVLLIGYGVFGERLVSAHLGVDPEGTLPAVAFCLAGGTAGFVGTIVSRYALGEPIEAVLVTLVFLLATGGLLGALLRTTLVTHETPLLLLGVGSALWVLWVLDPTPGTTGLLAALAITLALGGVSYAMGAASPPGMLAGVLLAFVTIVLGGFDWFAVLLTFFGLGSISTKFRYETKARRGMAEANDGARGSSNVLGNATVALGCVVGYAASEAGVVDVDRWLFLFAFAGSVATALSDTLSSEIGGVFDEPRLITTFERVEPGTDGGVTWQGELAGFVGAGTVSLVTILVFPEVGAIGATIVFVAGVAGMTVDSLLGATLEGERLGNQGVNFLATLSGALVAVCFLLVLAANGAV